MESMTNTNAIRKILENLINTVSEFHEGYIGRKILEVSMSYNYETPVRLYQ